MDPDASTANFKSIRGPTLWALSTLFLFAAVIVADRYLAAVSANTAVQALLAHREVSFDPSRAPPNEILARVDDYLWRDDINNAEALLNNTAVTLPPGVRAKALYNIANARTLHGAELARKGDIAGATALVNVAKSEYRAALRLTPDDWDIKYNIDVAMRIVRDLPISNNPDEQPQDMPKKLWTDLPGIPKGLP